MLFIEILKTIFLGVVEGVTEWLPISSTGHMLLVDQFLHLNASDEFKEMFFIVIQLGAIMAVVLLFWNKMFPFQFKDKSQPIVKKNILIIWLKVIIACIPGAVVTLLFDDWFEAHFKTPSAISIALIFYGILFIVVETFNKKRSPKVNDIGEITCLTALYIGLFQVLSIIPGTSRSGATIIGALILGVSRTAAAEFTFFLAVPVMLGYSLLKVVKYALDFGLKFSGSEIAILLVGVITAFAVSLFVIKFLMNFIKKNDFKVFGYYRIALGIIILILIFTPVL
ncbi:MAG: undecaprenyl-diphosphate phosphatase [Christensenellaceae bacterium]